MIKKLLFSISAFIATILTTTAWSQSGDSLQIIQLTANTFQHITYLKTNDFGNVPCNGLIVRDKGEAIIYDTPSYDEDSKKLIAWVEENLHCKVVAVVATHFHIDCLGGLNEFHRRGIPSYASNKTIALAERHNSPVPQNGFDDKMKLKVGTKKVVNEYLGEGHTRDNIVGYFSSEQVLFGGCLVKAVGAGKGNLEDANVFGWPATVTKVKSRYKKAKVIIPGHGKPGGHELLDFTIQLFGK